MEEFMLLKQQNDEYQSKLSDYEHMLKSKQAEFENYRKRTVREKSDFLKYAGLEIFKDLLMTIDNFDRALTVEVNDDSQKSFLEGFQLIDNQFKELLKKHNVIEIDGVGTEFDPNLHQAIAFDENDTVSCDTVSEVFQKGYLLHDRVIRTATVKVTKPGEEDSKEKETSEDTEVSDNDIN
jgi:molecular chaperone GrpE